MIEELATQGERSGLKMNIKKTKMVTNREYSTKTTVYGNEIEQ